MPYNGQLPNDEYLTCWFRAAVTGAAALLSLATATVLFCHAVPGQMFSHSTLTDAIEAALAAETLVLLGASTYAIGRAHGVTAYQGPSL